MKTEFIPVDDSNALASARQPTGVHPALPSAQEKCVFGIRIGAIGFLVSPSIYCEVLDKTPVNPLPNTAPWLSGLVNLRGNLVPVFDLHVVLSEEVVNPKNRRLFVLGRGDDAAAVWIDGLPVIKSSGLFQTETDLSALPIIQRRFVMGGYEQDGQIWFNINFEDLFKALGHQHVLGDSLA